jgi:hypothetical protein
MTPAQTAALRVARTRGTVHNAKTRHNVPGWDGSVTEPTVRRDRDMGSVYTPVLAYLSPAGKRGACHEH